MSEETALAVLEKPQPTIQNEEQLNVLIRQAKGLLESGFLPKKVDTVQKVFAIMQKGRELGVPAMYALSNISVIDGKPTTGSELMLALIYRDHGDNALRVTYSDAKRCVVRFKRASWPDESETSFTIEEAKTAGLLGKDNWQKYPAAMLRARAISAAARIGFPDSIAGLYTPDELGASVTVDAAGGYEIIEGTLVPEVRQALEATGQPPGYADARRTEPLPEEARGRADAIQAEVDQDVAASQGTERLTYESSGGNIRMNVPNPANHAPKPISQNAVATIVKLSKLTERTVPDDIEHWTAAQGAERIRELSRLYNEQQSPTRNTGKAAPPGAEVYETAAAQDSVEI